MTEGLSRVEQRKYEDLSVMDEASTPAEVPAGEAEVSKGTVYDASSVSSPIEGSILTAGTNTTFKAGSGNIFGDTTAAENDLGISFSSTKPKENNEFLKKALECIKSSDIKSEEEKIRLIAELEKQLKSAKTTDEKTALVADFITNNNVKLYQRKTKDLFKFYLMTEVSDEKLEELLSEGGDVKGRTEYARAMKILNRRISNNVQENGIRKYLLNNVSEFTTSEFDIDKEAVAQKLVHLNDDLRATKKLPKEQARIEAKKIADKFYEDTRIKIELPKLRELIKKYAQENKLSDEVKEKIIKQYSDARTIIRESAVEMSEDAEHREILMKRGREDNLKAQKDIYHEFDEHVSKNMTEEDYKKHLKTLDKFSEFQENDIGEFLDKDFFSEEFRNRMKKESVKYLERVAKQRIQYIQEFFETEKGKAIRAYTRRYIAEVREAKKDYIEAKEVSEKANEEAEIAKEECEKAIAKAKEEEQKARNIAEKIGYKDLEYEDLYKVVKQESTRQAVDLEWAQAAKKKAKNAQYDAESTQRLANAFERIARQKLAFARIRIWAAMQAVQSFCR